MWVSVCLQAEAGTRGWRPWQRAGKGQGDPWNSPSPPPLTRHRQAGDQSRDGVGVAGRRDVIVRCVRSVVDS